MSRLQSQNPIIPERIKKTISRVDCENAKGLIQCVTVTGGESLSKTAVCERGEAGVCWTLKNRTG